MTASLRDNTKNNQERNKVRNKVRQGSKDIAKMFINTIEVNSPYLGKEAHILIFFRLSLLYQKGNRMLEFLYHCDCHY
jgi:hypothetical protein